MGSAKYVTVKPVVSPLGDGCREASAARLVMPGRWMILNAHGSVRCLSRKR